MSSRSCVRHTAGADDETEAVCERGCRARRRDTQRQCREAYARACAWIAAKEGTYLGRQGGVLGQQFEQRRCREVLRERVAGRVQYGATLRDVLRTRAERAEHLLRLRPLGGILSVV